MKFTLLTIASVAAATASNGSTVVCPDCKPASSTPDVVTRSAIPTTSCNAPKLTTVPVGDVTVTRTHTITSCAPTVTNCPIGKKTTEVVTIPSGSHNTAPTTVPIGAAGSVKALNGAVAVVAAAVAFAL